MQTQKIGIFGQAQFQIPGEGIQTPIIQIPLLPTDGSFLITGSILATQTGQPSERFSVAYNIQLAGPMQGGEVLGTTALVKTTIPTDGGTSQGWAPGPIGFPNTGRNMTLSVVGIVGQVIAWSWDLTVELVTLP
jgi:hypothetical protein